MRRESFPISEANGQLAWNTARLDMRSWYEPRDDYTIMPFPEKIQEALNLDMLQAGLNERMKAFCGNHGLSHQTVQTANLYNWFLRSLRRPEELGVPDTLPITPTLSAGNPEETAVYANLWGLGELTTEQYENAGRFIKALGVDLQTRVLPNRVISIRQRCLRIKDYETEDTFHNPVFNMDGNNYLGTKLKPSEFTTYMLDTVESLCFNPSDMHVAYHPGGSVRIARDSINHQVYVPEIVEATATMTDWFKKKGLNPEDQMHAYSPRQDRDNGMGVVWGPGGNAHWDKSGRQIYGPFGPHFEVFIKIGEVYYEIANGIFKKYMATEDCLYTLTANGEGQALAVPGIHDEGFAPTVSMEGVFGYERVLALQDYFGRKDLNVERPNLIRSSQPWESQNYQTIEDGPNVYAVPGTSTYALMKFLSDKRIVIDFPGESVYRSAADMAKKEDLRSFAAKWTALMQLFHSGYPVDHEVLVKHVKDCQRQLKNIYLRLKWGDSKYSWKELVIDMEKTVVGSDPEFFRRRRKGFTEMFLGERERKETKKTLEFIRSRRFAETISSFVNQLETSKEGVNFSGYTVPGEINKIMTDAGLSSRDITTIWQILAEPIYQIYTYGTSYFRYISNIAERLTHAIAVLENRESPPLNSEGTFNRLREIPEIGEIARLTEKNVFPTDLPYLQKLLFLRVSALDRYFQLQLLPAFATEYGFTDSGGKDRLEKEAARVFLLGNSSAEELLTAVSGIELPEDLYWQIFSSGGDYYMNKLLPRIRINTLISYLLRNGNDKVVLEILNRTARRTYEEWKNVMRGGHNG